MARYATTVRSERPAPVAFAFVADLSNLPQWDPGVQEVSQLRGDGLGAEAAYEVVLSSAGNTRLVYEMTEFDCEALTATLVATHSWFRSIDVTILKHCWMQLAGMSGTLGTNVQLPWSTR